MNVPSKLTVGRILATVTILIGLAGICDRDGLYAADAGNETEDPPAPASTAEDAEPAVDAPGEEPDSAEADYPEFLRQGEVLVFRLSWGIFSTAGHLRIETAEEEATSEHERRIRISIHTRSQGLISAFFPVDTNAVTYLDPATGRPLLIEREGKEGDRQTHTTTVYDYEAHRVVHTDHNRPHRSGEAELPDEPSYDTFVAMMLARTWELQPGQKRLLLSTFEDDIYEIEATALKKERVKTPAGRFNTVEIELKQVGELKGFFRKGGRVRFFISQDEKPQIVRIELSAKAGTFVMQLERVEQVDEADTPANDKED